MRIHTPSLPRTEPASSETVSCFNDRLTLAAFDRSLNASVVLLVLDWM